MTRVDTEEAFQENTKFKDGVNKNARLIVRNIPFKASEEDLKKHFAPYGTVEEVKLLKRPDGKLVGCGFVHFTHVPMANKALSVTNKKPFLGRPLTVAWAVSRDKYGEKVQNTGAGDRNRTTSISSDDDAKVDIKKEKTQDAKLRQDKLRVNRKARLIVRNISFKATEESLKEHFQPYGELLEVKLLKKQDGKLVGCAFIHYKNVPMAKKALLSTNMKPFLGRPISVDWAVAKDKYMQHAINRELEMQEQVKKEDSDSDDEGPSFNTSNEELKKEVKSESDDSDDDGDIKSEEDSKSEDEKSSGDEESSDQDDDEEMEVDGDEDNKSQISETSTQADRQRVKLNDAEDGCTVFLTNIPFSVDNDQLKEFAERTGSVKYALVCIDKLTEHSKGSGFVKFMNSEDADRFLKLPADQLKLESQIVHVKPALKRESLQHGNKKEAKDNRNLYLVKEGVVVAGTKAAVGVSASDMAKRLALERSKTQMLKNLNRFVSKYRIVISNLPSHYVDSNLRKLCVDAVGQKAVITEARVMRDLRAAPGKDGRHPSKGYGFVMFMRHEDALTCLRKLNNNPDVFDKNNRPIVSFSIEDRQALNARKKRLEKSIANNPLANKPETNENQINYTKRKNRKRKMNMPPDESYVKKGRYEKKGQLKSNESKGQFKKGNDLRNVSERDQETEYTGLTAKQGSQHKMRSNQKLRTQAEVHRQNVKLEKKKSIRKQRLKMAAKERIKLPKQKINKTTNKSKNKRRFKDKSVF